MRELKTSDIFKMSKILKKMELKLNSVKDKDERQVGAELIKSVFENLHLAEKEINEFLADINDMKVEEFENLPINETIKIINQFKELNGINDFFKRATQ